MSKTENFVNPNVLPSFFKDLKIIGPASLQIPKYRELHANLEKASLTSPNCLFAAEGTPMLISNQTVKGYYQNNNFDAIRALEKQANDDLQSVYTNIQTNGINAWTLVESAGQQFYISYSDTGVVWVQTISGPVLVKADDSGDTSYSLVVQFGTYSPSAKVAGVHSYNITVPSLITEAAIALIVAMALSEVVAEGLGFLVAGLSLLLTEAAVDIGLESFSFAIAASTLSAVAVGLVFVVVFIGLFFLWDWVNQKYTIRLQIFNWDTVNSWNANGQNYSNAKICGNEQSLNFKLPPYSSCNPLPPWLHNITPLDMVCSYAQIIWENDNTFLEGCSMAIQMQKNALSEGFTWAFDCPRFDDNKQAAIDGLFDLADYRANPPWSYSPLRLQVNCTETSIPVSFSLSALSGASDGLYNVLIHINQCLV